MNIYSNNQIYNNRAAQRPSCRSWCWCWWLCCVRLGRIGFVWHTETEGIRNDCVCNGFSETSQSRLQIVFGFWGCTVPPLCYRSIGNSSWSARSLFHIHASGLVCLEDLIMAPRIHTILRWIPTRGWHSSLRLNLFDAESRQPCIHCIKTHFIKSNIC